MAVTVTQDVIEMTAAADEILQPVIAQSVEFVPAVGSLMGDVVTLTDPVTGGVLWTRNVNGPIASRQTLMSSGDGNARAWRNGVRVGTLTGNNGTVYIRYV